MTAFAYRDGVLCAEAVPLPDIAEAVGTPFYCYAAGAIEHAYGALAEAFTGQPAAIYFAVKANGNVAVLRTLAKLGAGMDIVSAGELQRALGAGVPAQRIVFSGVGKTQEEIRMALAAGVHQLNVESVPELHAISQVATAMGRTAPIALRVNPDVDALTLRQITTGTRHNKFGIDLGAAREAYRLATRLPGLAPRAVAVHIGSQISDLAPYREAYKRIGGLVQALRDDGIAIGRLDLGGGLAIAYRDEPPVDVDAYAGIVRETLGPLGCDLMLEPGRFLVGKAGVLVGRVIYRKSDLAREFLIVDAAMNDLLRPALYQAWHTILPVREAPPQEARRVYDIVGPVCESTDQFAENRPLPPMEENDLLAVADAGAYGAVMASQYNGRPLVPEVLVRGGAFAVVRKRPTFDEMLRGESIPAWL